MTLVTDTGGMLGAAITRLDAAVSEIRATLRDHENWHQRQLVQQLDAAKRAPGRFAGLAAALLSAVAAAAAGWAAFHPRPVLVDVPPAKVSVTGQQIPGAVGH